MTWNSILYGNGSSFEFHLVFYLEVVLVCLCTQQCWSLGKLVITSLFLLLQGFKVKQCLWSMFSSILVRIDKITCIFWILVMNNIDNEKLFFCFCCFGAWWGAMTKRNHFLCLGFVKLGEEWQFFCRAWWRVVVKRKHLLCFL
jgi:hypothetical protein